MSIRRLLSFHHQFLWILLWWLGMTPKSSSPGRFWPLANENKTSPVVPLISFYEYSYGDLIQRRYVASPSMIVLIFFGIHIEVIFLEGQADGRKFKSALWQILQQYFSFHFIFIDSNKPRFLSFRQQITDKAFMQNYIHSGHTFVSANIIFKKSHEQQSYYTIILQKDGKQEHWLHISKGEEVLFFHFTVTVTSWYKLPVKQHGKVLFSCSANTVKRRGKGSLLPTWL
jgi:hypothetical protein